jgi:hypothetical protein
MRIISAPPSIVVRTDSTAGIRTNADPKTPWFCISVVTSSSILTTTNLVFAILRFRIQQLG